MAREMKDSGIEWIGEIPREWEVVFAKQVFSEIKNKNTDGDVKLALKFKFGKIVEKNNFEADLDEYVADTITTYTIVEPNTIMINGLNLNYDFKTQRVAIVEKRGAITSAYLALKPDESVIYPYFANYLFKGYETKMAFHNMGAGIRLTLGFKEFKKQPVLIPPLPEQQRIADFLDKKCAEIDSVISQTEKTIEEYKALKQSVITEAVTKGVRGSRPMKDSGIEWIGEIPEEWEVSRMKFVAEFQPTCNISHLSEDSIVTYTPMENIKNGFFVSNTSRFGDISSSLTQYSEGDIVMAKVTPCFENGNIAIMKGLSSGIGFGSSELFVFRSTEIKTEFLFYWLRNNKFVDLACSTMTGTGGLKRVSPYFVKNSEITLPDVFEQQEIADYLDKKCAEIDKLIEAKQQLLTEMESYKKSVIYEYVTGKKEV